MHKQDLIKSIAEQSGQTQKEVSNVIDLFLSTVKKGLLSGDKVTLIGFGTFSVVNTKEKKGRNPQTGKEIRIPASKKVKFAPGKALKEEVKSSKKKK